MKQNLFSTEKPTRSAQVTEDVCNYSDALFYLHKSRDFVLDALRVQNNNEEVVQSLYANNWRELFDAVENEMKTQIGEAVSENALEAVVSPKTLRAL